MMTYLMTPLMMGLFVQYAAHQCAATSSVIVTTIQMLGVQSWVLDYQSGRK
jgi:hypothetical protein